MSEETVTTPANASENTASAPTPGSVAKKAAVPSPKAIATKTPAVASASTHSAADMSEAQSHGRVAEDGTVFVTENGTEREVGQYPNATAEEALAFYARRFLDLKAKLDHFEAHLATNSIKSHEIDESLKTLDSETTAPAVVGNTIALREQFERVKAAGEAKKAELAKERAAAVEKAVEERTAIVEKAESIAQSLSDSTNWRNTAEEFKTLFEQWQQHQKTSARIDKPRADELWKRFSSARSTFNSARRQWQQVRDAQRTNARKTKEEIIAAAEEIQNSTEWGATSRKFNDLMDQWKQAGRVGRREDDDALWKRFRAAADTFFNARQAERDQTNAGEQENLKKKEDLLTKAEALLPVADIKAAQVARKALSAIQDEWDTIGYVPRSEVRRIENRLDAVEKQIKAVEDAQWTQSNPEETARKSEFEEQLTAQLKELDEKIAAETDETKKKALQAEKATKEQWLSVIR